MMKPVLRIDGTNASPTEGTPVIDWPKALWNGGLLAITIIGGPLFFSWSAFVLFLVTTYLTLLIGHSVGMHRMLIHRAFQCGKPLERFLIYVGVIVGVAGPLGRGVFWRGRENFSQYEWNFEHEEDAIMFSLIWS